MTSKQADWISARAYSLWEESGRKHGDDALHWRQAVEEYDQLDSTRATIDGADVKSGWTRNAAPAAAREKKRKAP